MSKQVCSCGALKQQYRCPVCSSPTGMTHVTILPPMGGSQLPMYPPPLLPQSLPHPLSVSTNYVLSSPEKVSPVRETSPDCGQSIKDSLVFLSVCEELVEEVVEEVFPEILRETVNSCIEHILHSRPVKDENSTLSDLRPLSDEGGRDMYSEAESLTKESPKEVCGWICGRMLDECVFEKLLEASLTRGSNLISSDICNNILEGLMFEELLREILTS